MLGTLAKLEQTKLTELQSLEKKLGRTLIAFSCKKVDIVLLKEEELSQIKKVEEKLSLSLVAVK
jgi:hypothetical protein